MRVFSTSYSPNYGEGEFSEVRLSGVLRTSPKRRSWKFGRVPKAPLRGPRGNPSAPPATSSWAQPTVVSETRAAGTTPSGSTTSAQPVAALLPLVVLKSAIDAWGHLGLLLRDCLMRRRA